MILDALFRPPADRALQLDKFAFEDLRFSMEQAIKSGKDDFVWKYEGENFYFDTSSAQELFNKVDSLNR